MGDYLSSLQNEEMAKPVFDFNRCLREDDYEGAYKVFQEKPEVIIGVRNPYNLPERLETFLHEMELVYNPAHAEEMRQAYYRMKDDREATFEALKLLIAVRHVACDRDSRVSPATMRIVFNT